MKDRLVDWLKENAQLRNIHGTEFAEIIFNNRDYRYMTIVGRYQAFRRIADYIMINNNDKEILKQINHAH